MKVFRTIGTALLVSVLGASLASAQSWTATTNPAPNAIGPLLQLRDGRVLAHSDQNGNPNVWYILTPSTTGSYQAGTWSGPYAMQASYGPFFFSTAVLTDGKTIVAEGGEYNFGSAVWTTMGSIGTLTPFGGVTWTANNPPTGWGTIGDAESVVLPNGKYLQANCCTKQTAIYNGPNSWIPAASVLAARNDESGYTSLPNGKVLMVDVQNNTNCGSTKSTEYYDYTTDTWTCGPQTTVQLWLQGDQELGAGVLTYPNNAHPQGSVIQFGGNVNATSVLDVASNTWIAGPTPANGLDQADGPGALEPNGKVLAMLSPGLFNGGCQFVEYDPVANTLANAPNSPQCPSDSSFVGHLMILPTGQIASVSYDSIINLYNPAPGVVGGVAPTILSAANLLIKGSVNNVLYGKQLNGLSENNYYGDDYQAATNYPLVQLKDVNTGIVWWAWTHDDSSHTIAPGAVGYTKFDLNPNMPGGVFDMTVITNGIPSNTVRVNVLSHGTK
jgi:hypothetical protein